MQKRKSAAICCHILIHKYKVKIIMCFMRKRISIIPVGFIAVMLLIGTHLARNSVVLILLCSINSGEYCKVKSIFVGAASTVISKKLRLKVCLGND